VTWIYLKSYQSWSRIFDFGNGQESNNVVLAMVDTTSQMTGSTFKGSSRSYIETSSSSIINLNEWYFISFFLNGTTGYIYVNDSQVATNTLNVPTITNMIDHLIVIKTIYFWQKYISTYV
jgi:hypothetical protein